MINGPPSVRQSCRESHWLRPPEDQPGKLRCRRDPCGRGSCGSSWRHIFTSRHDAHVAAQAGAAGRRRNGTAGGDEGFNITGLHGFHVDVLAAGNDDAAHIRMDLCLSNICSDFQIFQTAIGTGPDDDLVDLDVAEVPMTLVFSGKCGKARPALIRTS